LDRREFVTTGVGLAVGAAVGTSIMPVGPTATAANTGLRTSKLPRGGAEVPVFACGSDPLIIGQANFVGLKLTNQDGVDRSTHRLRARG
jgi:hypothetical protein